MFVFVKVTWAHAVNSPSKLNQALSSDIMMLEADVQMRHNKTDTEPIMAHPPNFDSNLTLAQFVDDVSKTPKGMKLDFKSIMAVEPSLKLLKNVSETKELKTPIWLNADILMGPCFDKVCTPVDAKQFIEDCKKYFPSSLLSIGWTTGNDVKPEKNKYTWIHVLEMGKLVVDVSQPITFPVRASLVKRSLPQLLWLLDISRNFTLTVWSSEKDTVDVKDLVELRRSVYNKKNVYYDLPQSQADAFAKALDGLDVSTSDPYQDKIYGALKGFAIQSCSDVIVGETKIMFSGKGGWVSTTKEVKAIDSTSNIHFQMEVSFLSLSTSDIQQNVTLVIGSKGLTTPDAEVKPQDGIQLVLQRSGEFTIIKPDGTKMEKKINTDPKFKYELGFSCGPNMKEISFSLISSAEELKPKFYKYDGDFKPDKQFVLVGVGDQEGAVLIEEISGAISMPSGSGSNSVLPNIVMLALAAILVAISAVLLAYE